ncbi:MAG: DUF475 domain-containing protein [Nanoarchaeota archaeon]
MDWISMILTVCGLIVFEVISSIDNAIINADVLGTMQKKSQKWFLFWGIIFGVFVVRGLLPWIIVWASTPGIGPISALIATFSGDAAVLEAVENSAPILLAGGGIYLIFLFFHWWFLEPKNYGLIGEKFIHKQGIWFYAVISIVLAVIVWFSLKVNPMMAFGAVIGSTAFFITHGFKQNAEQAELSLKKKGSMGDTSKILYLEVIDTTFSIDGVLGAFAFTLSVPLILLGNGIGAIIVRNLTIKGVDKIKKYAYLKNGAMYSIYVLGIIMLLDSFAFEIPSFVSPIVTFAIVGYFFWKSKATSVKGFVKEL